MFAFLKAIGLLNTLPGLSASLLGLAIPVSVFVMRAYFAALPSELGDAARIDGASELGVFLRIYLPLARPGLATVVIFQFVATWNEFFFSTALISDPRLKTIQPGVYQAVGRYSIDYPLLSAGLVIALLPILGIFVLIQRQVVEGLAAGALKA
jgi:ABC-type glycerol-3-phosphate transport system permease component